MWSHLRFNKETSLLLKKLSSLQIQTLHICPPFPQPVTDLPSRSEGILKRHALCSLAQTADISISLSAERKWRTTWGCPEEEPASRRKSYNLSGDWDFFFFFLQEKNVLLRQCWAGDHTCALLWLLKHHSHIRTSWRWTREVTASLPPPSQCGHFVLPATMTVAPLVGSLRIGKQTWHAGAQTATPWVW